MKKAPCSGQLISTSVNSGRLLSASLRTRSAMLLRQSEGQVGAGFYTALCHAGLDPASGRTGYRLGGRYDKSVGHRSRAAQAAESKGGITELSFGRLAPPRFCFFCLRRRASVFWFVPPRFCFGDSIVMPDLPALRSLVRRPVPAPRKTGYRLGGRCDKSVGHRSRAVR